MRNLLLSIEERGRCQCVSGSVCVNACVQLAAPDNIEQQFKALEGDSVNDDLAAMKAGRLKGGNSSRGQLPEGRPYDQVFKKDAIDEVRQPLPPLQWCCLAVQNATRPALQ